MLEAHEPNARHLHEVEPALVKQLSLMATAPAGVQRLRELILTLAVQGKLVPQVFTDKPASNLVQQIRAEKDRLIADGKMKREKPSAAVSDHEIPHQVPDQWVWCRLGSVAKKITDGTHHSPANFPAGDFKYLSAKNIKSWGIDLNGMTYVPASVHQEIYSRCDPEHGDILYIKDGATTGVLTINTLKEPFSLLSSVGVIKPSCGLTSEYLALVMRSPYFYQAMRDGMTGVAITRVTLTKLASALVPLPPLNEQARIVARVDELMRLCDALEAKGQLEAEQHAQLLSTLLGALSDSASPGELAANWQRVADHFDLLLDRPNAVDALEQTILQLAVRGLLLPQDPNDEPASGLMEQIRSEKYRQWDAGEIKRRTSEPAPSEVDAWFDLPQSWLWARLPELASIAGGATPSKADASNWTGDIPWVSPKDMKVPTIANAQDHVAPSALAGSLNLIPPGSLLMVVRGMILAHSFPVAQTIVPVTINQDMKALTPFDSRLLPFLLLLCEGLKPEILSLVERSTHGTCKLESSKIFGVAFPIPPLEEQIRIVARVRDLRRDCAGLRQRLVAGKTTQANLAEVLVAEAAM